MKTSVSARGNFIPLSIAEMDAREVYARFASISCDNSFSKRYVFIRSPTVVKFLSFDMQIPAFSNGLAIGWLDITSKKYT